MVEFNKLVRDKIPEIIERDNKQAIISILSDEEYEKELDRKLQEETEEYLESGEVEEIVDVYEVILAILNTREVLLEEFWGLREDKYGQKVAFEDKAPTIVENDNKQAIFNILSNEKYSEELDKKLGEEVGKYLERGTVDELVDIFELILTILNVRNVLLEEFFRLRAEKFRQRGVFREKIFLHEVIETEKSEFYERFTRIVRECDYNNTYKVAWAKALVEIASEMDPNQEVISLMDISEKFIGYYWNQNLNHDIKQGQRNPKILKDVGDLIEAYSWIYDIDKFENCEYNLKTTFEKDWKKLLGKVRTTLKKDVSHRFLNMDHETLTGVYDYNEGDNEIFMKAEDIKTLDDNKEYLIDLIDYRWGLILEKFAGMSSADKIYGEELNQDNLRRFKNYLY